MYALVDENYNHIKEFHDYAEAIREMTIHNSLNNNEWDIIEVITDQENK